MSFFCGGHLKIKGNEKVDELAGEGSQRKLFRSRTPVCNSKRSRSDLSAFFGVLTCHLKQN